MTSIVFMQPVFVVYSKCGGDVYTISDEVGHHGAWLAIMTFADGFRHAIASPIQVEFRIVPISYADE